ncbi:MAG TPA: MmgE/PrpD family protein [Geobacterales bacterium]|nr:MmgE/PrpD family protein [Geobacterales bacterium]
MTDQLARRIADFVLSLEYDDLRPEVVNEAKRRIIDTFSVALPALEEETIKMVRKVVENTRSERDARIWGLGKKTTLDYAAFVNSSMTRFYDYNDTYLSKEALHPSDCIAGLIAIAEAKNKTGKDLITALALAYELICKLADASSIRERGWDHVSYIAIGATAGIGKLLDLDAQKLTQAINLTASNVITLRQTRIGELSMWKGLSSPNAVRNATFYSLLAEQGITGPSPVFEGERGFFKQVSGEFELDLELDNKILETSIKNYPVEYHSMGAAEVAFKIRDKIDVNKIESIEIGTFKVSYNIIVKDPEKWDPKTKETADHSLPFIVAYILANGKIEVDSYYDLFNPKVKSLMKKIRIYVDDELDKMYPQGCPAKIKVVTSDGQKVEDEIIYPKGHYRNPLTEEELNTKFMKMTKPLLGERTKTILNELRNIEDKSISDVVEALTYK